MGVDSELWWSVWWPWVVVVSVGVVALAVAIGSFVLAWRVRHRFSPARRAPGLPLYVDKPAIENAHRLDGGYSDLIAKEVTRTVGVTKDGKLNIPGVSVDVGKATSTEIVETYVHKFTAIDVAGLLLKALDNGDNLLHVDLRKRTVRRTPELERVAAKTGFDPGQFGELETFVLVRGAFTYTGDGTGSRVYLAPIGSEPESGEGPQARVECEAEWLLGPERMWKTGFNAVCFGRVLAWQDQQLIIYPYAIFQ